MGGVLLKGEILQDDVSLHALPRHLSLPVIGCNLSGECVLAMYSRGLLIFYILS